MEPDREREALIDYFQRLSAGEDVPDVPQPRDPRLRRLLEEFDEQYDLTLPIHPRDNATPRLVERAAMDRTVCFLRSGLDYEPLDDGRWGVGGYVFLGGIAVMLTGIVLSLCGFEWALWLMFAGVAIAFGPHFVFYALTMGLGAIHVFRVRVLRRDCSHFVEDDYWPFPSLDAWRAVRDASPSAP